MASGCSLEIEMATYSDAGRRALLNADLEGGRLRLVDSAGNHVHGDIAEAHQRSWAKTADDERFALAVDTPGSTAAAFDVPSTELAIVAALRRVGRAEHLDDAGTHRITERIEHTLGIVMASRVEGPNGASVYVSDWTDAVGEMLLSETIDDGDQIDRTWLVMKWLTDHPEDDTSRGCDSKGQSKGRLGAYRVGRALKSFHELGIAVRAPSTVTVVDRTALAAFLETRRLAPRGVSTFEIRTGMVS
jgi:hypothetical protein